MKVAIYVGENPTLTVLKNSFPALNFSALSTHGNMRSKKAIEKIAHNHKADEVRALSWVAMLRANDTVLSDVLTLEKSHYVRRVLAEINMAQGETSNALNNITPVNKSLTLQDLLGILSHSSAISNVANGIYVESEILEVGSWLSAYAANKDEIFRRSLPSWRTLINSSWRMTYRHRVLFFTVMNA